MVLNGMAQQQLVIFDGTCGLCHGAVRFIVRRDPTERFVFLSRENELAQPWQTDASDPSADTLILVKQGEVHTYSTAALEIARGLSGAWPLFYALIIVPRPIRDWMYRLVGRHRYRWFGRRALCDLTVQLPVSRFVADAESLRQVLEA